MAMAEDLARERGCVGVWLDTFDFQAPEFYRKHGYEQFGRLDDYPPGHQRLFFQKRLQGE
jgi:ribosomal protein S18 acetylase RimI-like enzyme